MLPKQVELSHFNNMSGFESEEMISFEQLGITEPLLRGIREAGFTSPSEIQQKTIPTILTGSDLIGQAQTGSGKTAAFSLPAIERLAFNKTVEVLVLVPTRELAQQVTDEMYRLGKYKRLQIASVVGGQSAFRQVELINRGAQIVVATPGRLLDHLQANALKRFEPKLVILDEADEMLDMGFIDDIKKIFSYISKERQTLLFSATMPPAICRLAESVLNNPVHIKSSTAHVQNDNISQHLYIVLEREREAALMRLINAENPEKSIIFCRTKRETDDLCQYLTQRGVRAKAIHGDLTQVARMQAVREIKEGVIQVLIGTDVASRGLDISDLTHVFNFHTPENKERYTHRIGRTGRAGKKGKAITLSTPSEIRNHTFYKQYPLRHFTICTVPNRAEVEKSRSDALMSEISRFEISPAVEQHWQAPTDQKEAQELIYRMYSYLLAQQKVDGPDNIGLSLSDIHRLSRTERFNRTPSIVRRGSSRGNGSNGRYQGQGKPYKPSYKDRYSKGPRSAR